MLVDENGNQIPIRRNHSYTLNIAGALSFGQDSFEAALEASATNNVWISISDEVNEVEDKNYILTVEKTFEVIDEGQVQGGTYTFKYTLKGKNGIRITEADRPEISWIDNSVASQGIDEVFSIENNVGNGSINITLRPLGNNEKLEGTLLVKHGRLQRKDQGNHGQETVVCPRVDRYSRVWRHRHGESYPRAFPRDGDVHRT